MQDNILVIQIYSLLCITGLTLYRISYIVGKSKHATYSTYVCYERAENDIQWSMWYFYSKRNWGIEKTCLIYRNYYNLIFLHKKRSFRYRWLKLEYEVYFMQLCKTLLAYRISIAIK